MTHDARSLAEIIGFLIAIMVLARACAAEGLFAAVGGQLERFSRGSRVRVLTCCIVFAAGVTAVLSLDTTVVLLTPVLLVASGVQPHRSSSFASVRLANSASTLLPISNLTNLLAFASTGLTFVAFALAMFPVWLAAIGLEYVALRWWFRDELAAPYDPQPRTAPAIPLFPLAVVIAVLFGLTSGATPVIPATAGAILVGTYALLRRTSTSSELLEAANLPLAAFVFIWALLVSYLSSTLVGDWVGNLLPSTAGLGALLTIALIAMVVANVVNNIPATLLLLPAATLAGPAGVLALLIGVNVGANLTVIGSLANLLWRQSAGRELSSLRQFHALGLATTPIIVTLCTAVLWGWTSLLW